MEWEILIDPLVDRYMFEGSLIQEDVRQVSDFVQSVVIIFLNQYEVMRNFNGYPNPTPPGTLHISPWYQFKYIERIPCSTSIISDVIFRLSLITHLHPSLPAPSRTP